jgi:hypothetical protein
MCVLLYTGWHIRVKNLVNIGKTSAQTQNASGIAKAVKAHFPHLSLNVLKTF